MMSLGRTIPQISGRYRRGRGTIIATVLLFIALVLPVTLILLNTIQIETLLPANENLRLLALHEAEKGFDAAIELLLQDSDEGIWINDPLGVAGFQDFNGQPLTVFPGVANQAVEPPVTGPALGLAFGLIPYAGWQMTAVNQTYFQPFYQKGEHEIDHLVEPWARHPENDTYYLASRSVENRPLPANRDETGNIPGGDPDEYTVPERWVLPNVPIGMDDFGERTIRTQRERLDSGFEVLPGSTGFQNPSSPMPVDEIVPTGGGNAGQPEGLPLDDGSNWAISPSDPDFATTPNRVEFAPRPASYFRNNSGSDNTIADTLTYDAANDAVGVGPLANQYLDFPPLQQLVRGAGWANVFFGGAVGGPTDRKNYEYKPAPGAITRYEVGGANANQQMPGWYESIVSDEASRFPLNGILNIIFQGGNYVYDDVDIPTSTGNVTVNASVDAPGVAPDKFDTRANADVLMYNRRHPNHYNYTLARDMLAGLFIPDDLMRDMDTGAANMAEEMFNAQGKANYIIRQMLFRRAELDRTYDGNGNGDADTSTVTYKDGLTNGVQTYDGNGRMGDGHDPKKQGTWQIYKHPMEILSDFEASGLFLTRAQADDGSPGATRQFFLRPSLDDFARLNQLVTVYSYDTEYTADPENSISPELFPYPGIHDRMNFNQIDAADIGNSVFSTAGILSRQIGTFRTRALLRWRDGLVDLNGDDDLEDEYVLQPVVDFDDVPINGDATLPHSQVTYRERNHPNFQDPRAAEENIFPAYLNVKNIGDLIAAPYNEITPSLYATEIGVGGNVLEKILFPGSGTTPVPGSDDTWNADLDPTGGTQALAFETPAAGGTGFTINLPNGPAAIPLAGTLQGTHPSYGPPSIGRLFVFQRTDTGTPELWVADAATGTPIVQLPQASRPLPVLLFAGAPPPAPFDLLTDLSGPDWNKAGMGQAFDFDRIAYSLGTGIDFDPGGPQPIQVFGDLFMYKAFIPTLPTPIRITNFGNSGTEAGFYPDWHPDGDSLIFTHVDLSNPLDAFRIATIDPDGTNLQDLNINFPGDPPGTIRVNLQPVYSPAGFSPLTIAFSSFTFDPFSGAVGDPEIFVVDASGGAATNVSQNPAGADFWPVFGEGIARLAAQTDAASGSTPGALLPCAACPLDPLTDRELIARYMGQASTAFRDNIGDSGVEENWRMRDLPVVPQHVADPLSALADELSFRTVRSTKDPGHTFFWAISGGSTPWPRLQAYPGRVNINTASRPVLRSIFMAMFQGALPVLETGGLSRPGGSTPRIDSGALFPAYIILPDPATNVQRRFDALKIADQYAHQVVQYRKWLYNNIFLISDDTVPNGLTESIDEFTGIHYRANPHVPYDSDNDVSTRERPYFDPDPAFRNIGDLFKVSLYFNYGNVTGNATSDDDVRLFEAVEGTAGPTWDNMPTAGALRNARTVMTWTWGPIYQTDVRSRYNGENAPGNGGTDELDPYITTPVLNRDSSPGGNDNYTSPYFEQQKYRLFSADDFRWVAPYLTTRSYVYRIESRGVIRVEAAQQFGSKMDITADKWWIVNMGDESVLNLAQDGGDYDQSYPIYTDVMTFSEDLIQNSGEVMHQTSRPRPFSVIAYQEQPESGVPLTRPTFLPSF